MTEEEAAALSGAGAAKAKRPVTGGDLFDEARMDVEEDLWGEEGEDDDPAWRPINLDELPDDDED